MLMVTYHYDDEQVTFDEAAQRLRDHGGRNIWVCVDGPHGHRLSVAPRPGGFAVRVSLTKSHALPTPEEALQLAEKIVTTYCDAETAIAVLQSGEGNVAMAAVSVRWAFKVAEIIEEEINRTGSDALKLLLMQASSEVEG
jgi:hypothetical protein